MRKAPPWTRKRLGRGFFCNFLSYFSQNPLTKYRYSDTTKTWKGGEKVEQEKEKSLQARTGNSKNPHPNACRAHRRNLASDYRKTYQVRLKGGDRYSPPSL